MSLSPGARLGAYEIVSRLGAGGMGEVYKARDTRLDRTVAIKVLPDTIAGDPEFRERFDREARAISQLTHPHICTLYDVGDEQGTAFLVMEYLEGETLADRLAKGALPLDQALRMAIEIASALDRAHRAGIVHRDLKPGNVMLTKTGAGSASSPQAKLIDFGLARTVASDAVKAAGATIATTMANLTVQGTILGTFQYMAPEQVEGKEADARTDIFAFGAVLYEMVTGTRAFEGASRASLMSAILVSNPPPIAASQPLTPPALDRVVSACLAKDPDRRWQSASDLGRELQWIAQPGPQSSAPPVERAGRWRRERLAWASVVLASVLTVALVSSARFYAQAPAEDLTRLSMTLPAGALNFAISPDGRTMAFNAPGPDGRTQLLWVRPLEALEPHYLPGTEDSLTPPFWSPDSQFIAFSAGGKLKKISVAGGLPVTICEMAPLVIGGDWNRDGVIIFGNGVIMRASAEGGAAPTPLTAQALPDQFQAFPTFLPDGHHFVYLRASSGDQGIYVGSIDATPAEQSTQRLIETHLMPAFAPARDSDVGHLLFMQDGALQARPFDVRRLALAGAAFPIADHVGNFRLSANFSTSTNGVLAYRTVGISLSRLMRYDRAGHVLGPAGEQGAYWGVSLSPDGTRVAATFDDGRAAGQGISLLELDRNAGEPLTFDMAPDFAPVWSPDGNHVAFVGSRAGGTGLYEKASSAGGQDKEQLLLSPTSAAKLTNDWSRDGRLLLYSSEDPTTKSDLWVLPLTADARPAGAPVPFLHSTFNERQGQFSPDAHWIAYVSDESGRPDVWVQPFPASSAEGSKTRISLDGGIQPRWRRDKEILYVSPDGKLMSVDVTTRPAFKRSIPRVLFAAPIHVVDETVDPFQWDVTASGDQFFIDTAATASEPLNIVFNWPSAIKK